MTQTFESENTSQPKAQVTVFSAQDWKSDDKQLQGGLEHQQGDHQTGQNNNIPDSGGQSCVVVNLVEEFESEKAT